MPQDKKSSPRIPEHPLDHARPKALWVAAAALALWGVDAGIARATAPCDDFGECKALIEINSTDGDIGFHFLMDGDDLNSARIHAPDGSKVFEEQAKGPLHDQKLTETFAESAEPLCWLDPDRDPDDEIVTLEEFLERWPDGTYVFTGSADGGEKSSGETELTYELPAAPIDLSFDDVTGVISWMPGDDLGECADAEELDELVAEGVLPVHPVNVAVAAWEAVFDPDDGSGLKFTIRLPPSQLSVTVPADYLASLPPNTPAKIEVGAIGETDNATFTEEGDLCINGMAC